MKNALISVAFAALRGALAVTVATALVACPAPALVDAGTSATQDAGSTLEDGGSDVVDGGGDPADDGGSAVEDGGSAAPDAGGGDAGGGDAGAPGGEDAGAPVYPPDAGVYEGEYWSGVSDELADQALVDALHARLLETHVELGYEALYDAYLETDGDVGGCAGIFDYYSDLCWAPEDRCGQYNEEGDCYNREHSWPKSWWGGSESAPQYSDLFHVIPADGYVNNQRGNHPLGTVTEATYTSGNGSKIGYCEQADASELCFEPIDALKGDLARIYFYMAVRYEGELACCDRAAVDGADLKPWGEALLRQWHVLDPVDDQERARNEAVFLLQGNRNPFVDDPYRVERISDF